MKAKFQDKILYGALLGRKSYVCIAIRLSQIPLLLYIVFTFQTEM